MSEWISVRDRLPPPGQFVLVVRDSGMLTTPYEYLTAQHDPNYKGWTDVQNDRVTDSGSSPTHWRPLLEPPQGVDRD